MTVCIIAMLTVSCEEKQVQEVEVQEKQKIQKAEVKETVHEVNMDQVVEGLQEVAQQEGYWDPWITINKFFEKNNYRYGEKWRLTGVVNDGPTCHSSCVLISEKYWDNRESGDALGASFLCADPENRHIFVQPGSKVVVEGTLKREGFLEDCTFIDPVIENPEFTPNVSEALQNMQQTQTIMGTIQEIRLMGLTDAERDALDFEHDYYDFARTSSHVGILSDGKNVINFYISQNNNENLQPGDRIAVRGKVSQEGEEAFVYCGDAVYRF